MPRLFMFVVIVFVYIVVAKNILFLEILSVILKKILVKFLPTPLSQSLSIEPEKSKPKKKNNTITFFETKIYPKIFWLKDQKNKTKRKKLTFENFVPILKNGLQTKKKLGWRNFSCKVSFYSESINVQITSATI